MLKKIKKAVLAGGPLVEAGCLGLCAFSLMSTNFWAGAFLGFYALLPFTRNAQVREMLKKVGQ